MLFFWRSIGTSGGGWERLLHTQGNGVSVVLVCGSQQARYVQTGARTATERSLPPQRR